MADEGDGTVLTRRRMLAGAAGAAGIIGLAGCTGEQAAEYAGNAQSAAQQGPPTRPVNPSQNEYAQFVLDSLEYQNQQAQAQTQGIAALLDDAGILSDDGGDSE